MATTSDATPAIILYMTCETVNEARCIASELLEERLIACANILPAHESLYRWDGAVQNDREVAAIMKSTVDHFEDIRKTVVSLHSYDCPCLLSWPLNNGHPDFLNWISAETGD